MKKILAVLSLLVVCMAMLTACGSKEEENKTWKACLITSTPRGNEFTDLIWSGLEDLEEEGWEVKCIETQETGEITEQVRAMVDEDYDIIYTQGDDVMTECKNLMDEVRETHPDTWFVFLDTYEKTDYENTCAVTIDPFEACFIAGYVAANTTETGAIGLMLPMDSAIMDRFEYGYYAGVDYANANCGTNATVYMAKTNTWTDTTLGYEATKQLVSTHKDIDVCIQAAYISGYGVIQACSDLEIKCIGVDDWQGDIDPCVFWSAVKSMNIAVYQSAHSIMDGEDIGRAKEYNLADGGAAYADVDLDNLKDGLADAVVQLKDDIISGKVDVFANGYEDWRETNFDQEGE